MNKRRFAGVLLALMIAAGSFPAAVSANEALLSVQSSTVQPLSGEGETTGKVLYVDSSASSAVENTYTTIQDAIEAAEDGDTIQIAEGTYSLQSNTHSSSINGPLTYGLKIDRSIRIQGAGAGKTVITSEVDGYDSGMVLFTKYDVNVEIDGISFEGGAWDIIGCDDPGVKNVSITNCAFNCTGTNSTPIKLKLLSGVISGNTFTGSNCGYGVRIIGLDKRDSSWGSSVPTDLSVDIDITGNDFSDLMLNSANPNRGLVHVTTVDPGLVTISGNKFGTVAADQYAVMNADSVASIEAPANYWGQNGTTATGIANLISGIVDVDSYYTDSTMGQLSDLGGIPVTTEEQLQNAIDKASAGATVVLGSDITVNKAIDIDKNIIINGNGHTLTANGCAALQIVADLNSLKISDLTVKGKLTSSQANDGTDAYMGLGTYDKNYGVGKLELSNVVIEGFSYGLYFGKNTTGSVSPLNDNPVTVIANNLTVQDCYIKGGYFEKLTDSTFTECKFIDNGTDPDKVSSDDQWLCGLDINLKNGVYQNISFTGCKFEGNGANRGTALHIKARTDSSYGLDTRLTGVTISGCTFDKNNATDSGDSNADFGPVVFGEPGKNNPSPTDISIQQDVSYTNNVTDVSVVTFEEADTSTQIVKTNETVTLPEPVKEGFEFQGWECGENTYNAGETVTISKDTSFTAVWKEKDPTPVEKTYTVTVNGEVLEQEYKKGEIVTITADPENAEGDKFSYWEVVSGNVTLADAAASTTTFTMPEENVVIRAVYAAAPVEKTYTATVNGETAEYKAGETVTISAPVYSNGLMFSRWRAVSGNVTFANAYSNVTTFVMPEENVEIQAVYTYIQVEPDLPEYNPDHSGSSGSSSTGGSSSDVQMPENGFGTDKNGNTYFFEDGEKVKGWVQDGDTWYYMDSHDGSMTTDGWLEVDGTWYNFAEDGKMNTGWIQDGDTWYYLKDWGGMATGWAQVDGKWYYLKDSGAMATGWAKVDGKWYYLKDSGAMATGWAKVDGKWYYLKDSGAMATGWVEVGGKWYYLKADGSMATNTTINGYYVNSNGEYIG